MMESDMTMTTHNLTKAGAQAELTGNLARYYLARAIIAAMWVSAAVATGGSNGTVAALLLVSYPAWDALANWLMPTAAVVSERTRRRRSMSQSASSPRSRWPSLC